MRKFLDSGERFGFMRVGKAATCKQCTARVGLNDPRVFDNASRTGPVCLHCAHALANIPVAPRESVEKTMALSDATNQALKRLEALEIRLNNTLESIPTIDPLSSELTGLESLDRRLRIIESFLYVQFQRQWEEYCRQYKG
jgi:hypothetical protein